MTNSLCIPDLSKLFGNTIKCRFIKKCLDILECVDINNITPEVGYYYSTKFGDVDLCIHDSNLHAQYTEQNKRKIQIEIALNVINILNILIAPFRQQYTNQDGVYCFTKISDVTYNKIHELCPSKKIRPECVSMCIDSIKLMIYNDMFIRPIENDIVNKAQLNKILNIQHIQSIFLSLLNLPEPIDVNEPEDIRRLLIYADKKNIYNVVNILRVMYMLSNCYEITEEDTDVYISNASSMVTVATPETVIDMTSMLAFNSVHTLKCYNEHTDLVYKYLYTLYTIF